MNFMQFSQFAHHLQTLETISSRLEMTAELAEVYRQLEPEEVMPANYLLQGSLVPAYESMEFQLSVKMLLRTLAGLWVGEVGSLGTGSVQDALFAEIDTKDNLIQVEQLYKQLGDVGQVAEQVLSKLPAAQQQLDIISVHQQLVAVAQASGAGSQERKIALLSALLRSVEPVAGKFIVRIVMGKLRLGFSVMTLLDALSWAVAGDKQYRNALEEAYQKKADIGSLAAGFLGHRNSPEALTNFLASYSAEVGIPIVPALCQRLNSAAEIIEKMGTVFVEPKYDGLRVQIHVGVVDGAGKRSVRVFTRNLENATHMFPELQALLEMIPGQAVFDGEAIGYDPTTGALKPFQETITRKRKHDIAETAESVPLRYYLFDVLAVDGASLLHKTLRERKSVLGKLIKQNEQFVITEATQTSDPTELRQLHEHFLAEGLEGAVIKKVDSVYQSGRKGWSWVKIKEEEGTRGKLTDTLDVIVLGYYRGRGKRAQFGMGAFLVGVREANTEAIKTIAKIGTGISEEQLASLRQLFDAEAVNTQPATYEVEKSLLPDVWVAPSIVVEVAADEITKSPVHTAGVALRFPRLIKVREDKNWQDATSVEELGEM